MALAALGLSDQPLREPFPEPQRLDRTMTLLFVTLLRARHSHPRLDQAAAGRTTRNEFRLARMVIVGDRGYPPPLSGSRRESSRCSRRFTTGQKGATADGHTLGRVKRAIYVAPFGELADPRVLAGLAVAAEERGWDGFFVWDHIVYRARCGPWPIRGWRSRRWRAPRAVCGSGR